MFQVPGLFFLFYLLGTSARLLVIGIRFEISLLSQSSVSMIPAQEFCRVAVILFVIRSRLLVPGCSILMINIRLQIMCYTDQAQEPLFRMVWIVFHCFVCLWYKKYFDRLCWTLRVLGILYDPGPGTIASTLDWVICVVIDCYPFKFPLVVKLLIAKL